MLIEFVLLVILIFLAIFCAYILGKSSNIRELVQIYKDMIHTTKQLATVGIERAEIKADLKYLKKVRALENSLVMAKPVVQQHEPTWEIVNDTQDMDSEIDPAAYFHSLPIRSEIATNSLQIRSEFATNSPILQKSSSRGVVAVEPLEGEKYFNRFSIRLQPSEDVITIYQKVEAGLRPIEHVKINLLQNGVPYKASSIVPYLLKCASDFCENVVLTSAHNAKYCGCKDCLK